MVDQVQKNGGECKLSCKIDSRGVIHIVRVLLRFRYGVFPAVKKNSGVRYVLEIAWLLLEKNKVDYRFCDSNIQQEHKI